MPTLKRTLAAERKAYRANMNRRIEGLAHSGPDPEYRVDRAQDTPTTVKSSADGGIRISHGRTQIVLDPSETAELIRVAKRLTGQPHT